ncbi:GntR family transcriptional regulator [Salinarimonas ramus]|uniref:Transcriptional regulator n=1 Tax=Salinarimonas ramus TaxID=690164 RepID=A0A917QFP4_9HYPH|nr:GntR family transcriptional regulator [Salinarimonas ramus]GGK49156.1 transcriptional regulator [Salinarimonas ramus]
MTANDEVESVEAAAGTGLDEEMTGLRRTSVFQKLRAEILTCTIRPGTRIQERDLADRFGVSKSPIRDALIKLEEQNLVEVMPRKGYRVKPISIADAREIYEMRLIYERECVGRLVETASDETIAGLAPYATMPEPIALSTWAAYNSAFHTALAIGCGNARLARAACEINEQADRLTMIGVATRDAGDLATFVREHAEIIAAIGERNRRRAAALMRAHIESSRRRVLEALESAAIVG